MVGKASAGAALVLFLAALVWSYAGYGGSAALAQYDDAAPEEQYGTPPADTAPVPEDQYGAPAGDPNGGGDTVLDGASTTTPAEGDANAPGGGNGGGEDEGGAAAPQAPDGAGAPPGLLDGFLADAALFLAVASLITTVLFFLERRGDRSGL